MALEPKYVILDELLQRRLFEIPNYQRNYSWGQKQRADLFNDIEKLAGYEKDERHHFMATIVCLNTKRREVVDADEYISLAVVDGQQRLTTLIILLKEISLALNRADNRQDKIFSDLHGLLVKGDKRIILLQTNHDSSNLFRHYLRDGTRPNSDRISIQADKNLTDAIEECHSFIQRWTKGHAEKLIDLLKLVKHRLSFVFYLLDDEASVYTVFEVLNSRGLDVDWLDKCKSTLMGIAYEHFQKDTASQHIDELHQNWRNIYAAMGLKVVSGEEILRFAATLKGQDRPRKPLSATESLEMIRKACEKDRERVIEFSQWMLRIAQELEKLSNNPRLEAITKISHARLLAVAILLSERIRGPKQTSLLAQWENTTFRIFGMCKRDARTKVGEYTSLAWDVANNQILDTEIAQKIHALGADYPIEKAINELSADTNCYEGWQDELRYFFYRYEEYLALQEGSKIENEIWDQIWRKSASTTIEHIFPQEPGFSSGWSGKFGRGRGVIENKVNKLGNLVLLPPGVNGKAANKDFLEKKKIYKRSRLRILNEIMELEDWDKEQLEKRQKHLLDWASREWK